MKEKLIAKAQELRQHGFTTGEIADELNVSMDTARWLTLQKAEVKTEAPVDFAINWKSIGGNSTRLSYVAGALSDLALSRGEADTVVGIAVSGVPFATLMADYIEDMKKKDKKKDIFHPNKHRKDSDETDDEGAMYVLGEIQRMQELLLTQYAKYLGMDYVSLMQIKLEALKNGINTKMMAKMNIQDFGGKGRGR